MAFSVFYLLFSALFLLPFSAATLHSTTALFRPQLLSDPPQNDAPTTYFEVTKPIPLPKTKPCSYLLLEHDFGYTYGHPPVLANYTPPSNCPSQKFSRIVLEWTATCKGRQFDRIFGVWLGGVEVLRSCSAEPRASGIVWTVNKDITRYNSLLMSNQILAVYLGNLIDSTYTGVYHAKIKIHFYPEEEGLSLGLKKSGNLFDSVADLIIPISRNLPLNDGLWFEVENSTDFESKEFKIPGNAYRAVLEVYVSFHENDEFWYGNPPNEYISANNLTGLPGNGPFREVIVSLDDKVVGAIWPFTVIYTGGINPLLWRPITGIGSFDLPSYDIEVTPFLGSLLDGNTHKVGFSVTNALNVWYIDANLHLWLNFKSQKTEGSLEKYISQPLSFSLISNFSGFDGSFLTKANRHITYTGWVKSSYGTITTEATQGFNFTNFMVMGNEGNLQIINQTIDFNDKVLAKMKSSVSSLKSDKKFIFTMYSDNVIHSNHTYSSIANLTLGFKEKRTKTSDSGQFFSSLVNLQNGQGSMLVKGSTVVSGLGNTQQAYHYIDDSLCYLRNISSSNYTILYDKESYDCKKRTRSQLHLQPVRRASLASHIVEKGAV
nr:peptide-N4-(N-acetyl-beta-glucosaminyl) asparagine amidase A-like [Ipomoea batatas]